MAIQEFFGVSKPRNGDISELHRFALEVDDKLRRISEKFSMLEGQQGRQSDHHGPINMQGNRVTGLPRAASMTDALTLADLLQRGLTIDPATNTVRSSVPISAPSNPTDPTGLVTRLELYRLLDAIIVSIGKLPVVYNNSDTSIVLTSPDVNKSYVIDNASAVQITLPAGSVDLVGSVHEAHRIGAGNLTIKAGGTNTIGTSIAGGTISSKVAAPPTAITLRLITTTRWAVVSVAGTWRTDA